MTTKKQMFEAAQEKFINDVIPILKKRDYFRGEADIKERSKTEEWFIGVDGWYYNVVVWKYPEMNRKLKPMIELRIRRESCIGGRYVKDEYDERAWIYLKHPHYASNVKDDKHNKFVDDYCFNNFERTKLERDYCPLCNKYTRAKAHDRSKMHIKNIVKSVRCLKLPTELQNKIAEYL
jgi:hypothetical protein